MPFKYKDPYRHKFEPLKYRVTNLGVYNQALKNRGNVTIWFNEKAIRSWHAKHNGKPGRPKIYSNFAIETAGIIHLVFHLPYRQTEGFLKSIVKMMRLDLQIPDYSTISRRLKNLSVSMRPVNYKKGVHIIIDTSTLSVHGADEFRVLNDKLTRIKGYRKLNIAINEHQIITACELTTIHGNDIKQMPKLLRRIPDHCNCIIADKNYDERKAYSAIIKYRPTHFIRPVERDKYNIIIRPQDNAKVRKRKGKYYPPERSEHIKMVREHGVMNWQKSTGYGQRSLVEVAFSRYKRILGRLMHAVSFKNQIVEAKLACKALNIMTTLGMPVTVRIK